MLAINSVRDPVSKLVFELSKLPGIGEKTATRLAYYIINQDSAYANALADALLNVKKSIILCSQCFNFTSSDPCQICSDSKRHQNQICVVEKPSDVLSIEQAMFLQDSHKSYRGVYHVLHGALSPLDGIGPDELKINALLNRLHQLKQGGADSPCEVILATNPSVEGEATAFYLSKNINPLNVKLTQMAHGLPMGGLLEYTDRQTIYKALENRMEIHW